MKLKVDQTRAVIRSYHYPRTPTQGRPTHLPFGIPLADILRNVQPGAFGYVAHLGWPEPDPMGWYMGIDWTLQNGDHHLTVYGDGTLLIAEYLYAAVSGDMTTGYYADAIRYTRGLTGGKALDAYVHGNGKTIGK